MVPIQSKKIAATLGVAWQRTIIKKQTLFPVWGEKGEPKRPRKGPPNLKLPYTLRATKGVNMHPYPVLQLSHPDGSKYIEEEEIKLCLVNSHDKSQPLPGSCSCGGAPVLAESKPYQISKKNGENFCKIKGGILEFSKLQIGCCTGTRGHGCSLCLKVEFVREGSPLKGKVVYSVPIDVGAKGPFAKIFCQNVNNSPALVSTPTNSIVPVKSQPKEVVLNNPLKTHYEGAEEMLSLLNSLKLQKYTHLFVQHEVDFQAFLQLTDEDLVKIGITKVGPRVKILREIDHLKESNLALSPPSCPSIDIDDNNFSWAFSLLDEIPFFQDDSFSGVELLPEQPTKKRKLLPSSCTTDLLGLEALDGDKSPAPSIEFQQLVA